jgi:hypothetical protein
LNVALLSLLAAALTGLGLTGFTLAWLRSSADALAGGGPGETLALPALLAGLALGAAAAGSPPAERIGRHASRWLAGASLGVLLVRWIGPVGGLASSWIVLAVLPASIALGAATTLLVGLRRAGGLVEAPATAGAMAALSTGALVALKLWRETPWRSGLVAAGALIAAALVAELLQVAGRPVAASPSRRSGGVATRLALLAGGACLLIGIAGRQRIADQWLGAELATSVELGSGLAGGALLVGILTWRLAPSGPLAVLSLLALGAALEMPIALTPPRLVAVLPAAVLGAALAGLMVAGAGRHGFRWTFVMLALGAALGAWWASVQGGPDLTTGSGLQRAATLACVVAMLLPMSASMGPGGRLLGALPGLALTAGILLTPPLELPWRLDEHDRELLLRHEDPRGVVSLVATADGWPQLRIDNRAVLEGPAGVLLSHRMARLSAALRPGAARALLIGLGDGELLRALSGATEAEVGCIETNGSLVGLPRSNGIRGEVQVAEPRRWLAERPRRYDLIVGGLVEPGARGAARRLSLEGFLALRSALAEDGVAVQWLALDRMPWPAFASAAQSFLAAFPDARVFVASLRADVPLVALAGGLGDGLPDPAAMDALLEASPSTAGPSGAADVFDLYVADGWTLMTRLRDVPTSTLAEPRAELISVRRAGEARNLSPTSMRQLAGLAVPLSTTSLARRPMDEKEDRRLGAELVARSAALVGLLAARATWIELEAAEPGSLSSLEQDALNDELGGALLRAWMAAPGHLDVRDALLECAARFSREERWALAEALLVPAVERLPDARLQGVLSRVLLERGSLDEAVELGLAARQAAPDDRTVLINLATALLFAARDEEALDVLRDARRVFGTAALPALPAAALALLEDAPQARQTADELLGRLASTEPWSAVLRRLQSVPSDDGG